jgi:hypothetical protein
MTEILRPVTLCASLFLPLGLASVSPAQQKPEPTWQEVLQVAVEHPRFAVRRAATGRLAKGGDAAVPALREFLAEHGNNALPLVVVDSLAKTGVGGDALGVLLREWSADPLFYWRSQALRGVARRAEPADLPQFRAALRDPSHLQRIEGVHGLLALDPGLVEEIGERPAESDEPSPNLAVAQRALRRETDPRARLRMALLLMRAESWVGLSDVLAAIDRADARWLDDPWGSREATFAVRELRRLGCGDFRDALAADPQTRADGRTILYNWALAQGHAHQPQVTLGGETAQAWSGGIEIRSCRSGDLHLRWTDTGRVSLGLTEVAAVQLNADAWRELRSGLRPLQGASVEGRVVCDFLRLLDPVTSGSPGRVHRKYAPEASPEKLVQWLEELRDLALTAGGRAGERLAAAVDDRLPQFRGE